MCTCVLNKTLCTWVWLFLTSLSVALQAPLSREFCRQEYWSGLPGPPPVYLPDPGLNPHLLCLLNWQMGSLPLAPPGKPKENMKWSESRSVVSDSLRAHGLHSPWNSPGQSIGVGSLSLLQGIFPTQGLNPGLLYCRRILYQLSHKGSPKILEWVVYPFSSGSSQLRNRTGVPCITGGFFTNWAMREAPRKTY